jgi:hypothetical protein
MGLTQDMEEIVNSGQSKISGMFHSRPSRLGAAMLLVALVAVITFFLRSDHRRYDAAMQLLDEGEYSLAEEAFSELSGFRDSDSLRTVCTRFAAYHDFISSGHYPGLEHGLGAERDEVEQTMGPPVQEFMADGGDHIAYELNGNYVCYGFPHEPFAGERGYACSRLIVGDSLALILGRSMQDVIALFGESDHFGFSEYHECWALSYDLDGCSLLLLAEDDTSEITALDMMWLY